MNRDGKIGNFSVIIAFIEKDDDLLPLCVPMCRLKFISYPMRYFDRFFEIRNNHPGIDDIFAARMSGRYQWPIRVLGRFKTGRECRGFSEGRQISVTFNIDVFRSIPRRSCFSRGSRRNIRRITGEEKKKRQRGRERGRKNESKREKERGEKKRRRETSFLERNQTGCRVSQSSL